MPISLLLNYSTDDKIKEIIKKYNKILINDRTIINLEKWDTAIYKDGIIYHWREKIITNNMWRSSRKILRLHLW